MLFSSDRKLLAIPVFSRIDLRSYATTRTQRHDLPWLRTGAPSQYGTLPPREHDQHQKSVDSGVAYFFAADLATATARYVLFLALAVWIKDVTGSASAAGLTMFFVLAGGLTAPVTGVLVDRLAVRQARSLPLILTAFAIAPLFFLDGHPVLELVYLIGFLYGLLSGMAEAAQTVLIKVIFDDAQLVAVNSVHQTLNRGLRVVAPLLGATRCADRGSPGVQTPGTAPPAGRHRGRRSVRSLLSQLLRDRGTANGDGRAEPPGRVPRSFRHRAGCATIVTGSCSPGTAATSPWRR
jgi:hypothetical protein